MSEKISEALWKAFVSKQKLAVSLEDKDLLKVLARFDKTDERKPEPRLEALKDLVKEIPKQVTALTKLKKGLGDKPFGLVKDELYAILEQAEALQKKTQATLDAKDVDDSDDEDSAAAALVNPKLLHRQLTLCRNDPERHMAFAFVDGRGKEQPAMLALHPRLGARALFAKLQAASGVKTGAFGTAWIDGTSLMLQLDKPLSGLVKKVRLPVKACGFKIAKAVLWNADGTVFEHDDAPEDAVSEDHDAAPTATQAPVAPPAPPQPSATYDAKLAALLPLVKAAAEAGSPDASKHQKLLDFALGKAGANDFLSAIAALKQVELLLQKPAATNATTATGDGHVDAGPAFKARLGALIPALKDARAAGRPGALDASAKATEAGMAAGKGDFERGQALLDEVEELLAGRATPSAEPAPKPPVEGGAPKGGVAFQRSRIMWVGVRQQILAEAQRLADKIIEQSRDDSDAEDIREAAGAIVKDVSRIDERLQKVLDQLTVSPEGEDRDRLKVQAMGVIAEYRATLSNGIFKTIDANPVLPVGIVEPTRVALAAISRTLA